MEADGSKFPCDTHSARVTAPENPGIGQRELGLRERLSIQTLYRIRCLVSKQVDHIC